MRPWVEKVYRALAGEGEQVNYPSLKDLGLSLALPATGASIRDNRLVDISPRTPGGVGMQTVNILPGSGFNLSEPPMLNVNVPTVCSTASEQSVLAHLYLLYRISVRNTSRNVVKVHWAKAAKAGAFLPGLKAPGLPALKGKHL